MQKRKTVQNQLVIDALHELRGHPTAQMIHHKIQEKYDGISIATVYSNLRSLAEDDVVRVLSFAGRSDRYDCNPAEHYHIRCQSCGAFCDLPVEGLAEVNPQIAEASGYTVINYEILFHGICPDCQKHKTTNYMKER